MICPPAEAKEFLKELGVSESGVGALIRATYHLLGLRTYFTAGEKEVRAWTIHAGDTAPKAAGVIHSDFERGFIKAETVAYDDLVKCGSVAAAREKGLVPDGRQGIRREGRRRDAVQVQCLSRLTKSSFYFPQVNFPRIILSEIAKQSFDKKWNPFRGYTRAAADIALPRQLKTVRLFIGIGKKVKANAFVRENQRR